MVAGAAPSGTEISKGMSRAGEAEAVVAAAARGESETVNTWGTNGARI